MGTAGDVEKQAVRRIDRHQRGEAVAPVGNGIQRLASAASSASYTRKCGQMARALASGRPILEAEMRGGIVERENLQRVVFLATTMLGATASVFLGTAHCSVYRF